MADPLAGGCDGKPITAYSPTNTPASMGATDLATAYGLNATGLPTGAGKIVAVVDACGYGTLLADLAAYRAAYGIPPISECGGADGIAPTPGAATPCIGIVSQTGTATLPTQDSNWSGETALDVQMVSAGCPACSILVVQATNSGTLPTALAEAIKLKADAVSNSWGSSESPFSTAITVKAGALVTAATGDADYLNQISSTQLADGGESYSYNPGTPNWPASEPNVVGVGGTTLTKDSTSARCYSDVAWSVTVPTTSTSPYAGDTVYGGGSGCSTLYAKPSYQSGLAMGSCTKRGSVDISAAADFSPGAFAASECVPKKPCGGIAVYGGGGWNPSVGTSASTPFATAVLVRMGLAAQASTLVNTTAAPGPAYFYSHGSAFTDVTVGNNDPSNTCTDVMCNAGTGWDGPTGWGVPDAYQLAILGGASGVVKATPVCPDVPDAGAGTDAGAGAKDASAGVDSATPPTNDDSGAQPPGDDSGTGPVIGSDDSGTPNLVDSGSGPGPVNDDGGGGNGAIGGDGSSSGCGCSLAPAETTPFASLLALGSVLALRLRRRRR
jgi:subtilase family serine protease